MVWALALNGSRGMGIDGLIIVRIQCKSKRNMLQTHGKDRGYGSNNVEDRQ